MHLVTLAALVGIATWFPSVNGHIGSLVDLARHLYLMPSARRATPSPLTIRLPVVVEHEEMIAVPALSIVADNGGYALLHVILHKVALFSSLLT